MVRGGWYHYLILDSAGAVTCIVGQNQETELANFTPKVGCIYNGDTGTYCVQECVPTVAPSGHPLAVPTISKASSTGVKSIENPTGKAVKDICCGAYHNIVRHVDGTITAWGLNSMGQCNVPTTSSKGSLIDPSNPWLKKVVGLHAGYSNSAVTFNDGTVVCWGDPTVADIVNGWTDLMMSPINHMPGAGQRVNQIDNVATDGSPRKEWYAKPAYSAAYNADSNLETWNLHSDWTFSWHNESDNAHCAPMFDLGVEVDPFNPLEWSPAVWPVTYNTDYPGYPMERITGSCDASSATDGAAWRDWIGQKWRNAVFNDPWGEGGVKSCCDLKVKSDFAVGIRRTGQVITSRHQTGALASMNCPTATSGDGGRSSCRDCSAELTMQASKIVKSDPSAGCPGTINASCYGYTGCNCCDATSSSDPGVYVGCAHCPDYICEAEQKFLNSNGAIETGGGFGSCTSHFFEGVGCIGANPTLENMHHAAEWATPAYDSLAGRWTAGQQVRYGAGLTTTPSANAHIYENFGWSTIPAYDTFHSPSKLIGDPECQANHATSAECNEMCKSHPDYRKGAFKFDSNPEYSYPPQMLMQGVFAGVDTTCWLNQARGFGTNGMCGQDCTGCYTFQRSGNISCAYDDFQGFSPNGGILTYGCIYAGLTLPSSVNHADSYGGVNAYRSGVFRATEPCSTGGASMLRFDNYRMPSKPWGPFQLAVRNSVGSQKNKEYPHCHCCGISEGCDDKYEGPPPGIPVVTRPVAGDVGIYSIETLDGALGTLFGMPNESNMACEPPTGSGGTYNHCVSFCKYTYQPSEPPAWSPYGPPFCTHNPPISTASGRLSFAMIRADHRDCVRDAGGNCVKDSGGKDVRSHPPGDCGEYPDIDHSQWIGCTAPPYPDGSQIITGRKMLVHIWGSLFDPCSPFSRVCDCTPDFADPITDTTGKYKFPCTPSHPENPSAPESLATDSSYRQPKYPPWTRVPSSNTTRSPAKGKWVGTTWTLLTGTEAGSEPSGPSTQYCPSCEDWSRQFHY